MTSPHSTELRRKPNRRTGSILLTAVVLSGAGLLAGRWLRHKPTSPLLSQVRSELKLNPVLDAELAVRRNPKDAEARLALAKAYAENGDPSGAAVALAPLMAGTERASDEARSRYVSACLAVGWIPEALPAVPDGEGATVRRLQLADTQVGHGDGAGAARTLAVFDPSSLPADADFTCARILLRARKYAEALQWAERGRRQTLDDPNGLVLAVRCYLATGNAPTALALFPPSTAAPLANPEAEFWRGRVEIRCPSPNVRAAGLERLVRIATGPASADGRSAIAAFEAGRAYLDAGRANEATRLLNQAWQASYQPTLCLYLLQSAYSSGGHMRDAAWCEGKLHIDLHQWPEAVASFQRCLKLDSSKPQTHLDLARALSSNGHPSDALKVLEEGEKKLPRNLDLVLLKAAVLGRLERASEEERELSQAAEWSGKRANEPLGNLGKVQYDSQQFDQAIPVLERAVATDPGDALAQLYLGLSYARRPEDPKQASLAVTHLLRSAQIQPDYHFPWVNAGAVLLGMGALPEAAASYRRAIDGDPRWDGPYLALAQIYQRQRLEEERRFMLRLYQGVKTRDAHRQELETAAKASGATAEAHLALGEQSLRDGRPKEALGELLVAAAQRPSWKEAQGRIADACALLDFDAMREEAERAAR